MKNKIVKLDKYKEKLIKENYYCILPKELTEEDKIKAFLSRPNFLFQLFKYDEEDPCFNNDGLRYRVTMYVRNTLSDTFYFYSQIQISSNEEGFDVDNFDSLCESKLKEEGFDEHINLFLSDILFQVTDCAESYRNKIILNLLNNCSSEENIINLFMDDHHNIDVCDFSLYMEEYLCKKIIIPKAIGKCKRCDKKDDCTNFKIFKSLYQTSQLNLNDLIQYINSDEYSELKTRLNIDETFDDLEDEINGLKNYSNSSNDDDLLN